MSSSVLEALARALQLDDAERAHLVHLARAAEGRAPSRRRPHQQWRPPTHLQWVLDTITAGPGCALTIYAAEPGSATEQNLRLLASWVATLLDSPDRA